MPTSGIRSKMRGVSRVCEDAGGAALTILVDVIKLVCERIETKRKNEAMSDRQTNLEAELMEALAVGRMTSGQSPAAEGRIKALKTQLADAHLPSEKLAAELSRTEADLLPEMVGTKKLLDAEKSRVKRLDRELSTEAEKRQQFLAERQETCWTASRPLTESDGSL